MPTVEALDEEGVIKYDGFYENAYRLVFAYEERYADTAPQHLLTILPSGIVETDKMLEAEPERGLIAYCYVQMIEPNKVESLRQTHGDAVDPFIIRREDGSFVVVQCWPTKYNEAWKKGFREYPKNPNKKKISDEAARYFHEAMIELFGEDARDQPVTFGVSSKRNEHPCYMGTGADLIRILKKSKALQESLQIIDVSADGFTTLITYPTKPEERVGDKTFKMDLTSQYALYTKVGYEKMACVKPAFQFYKESSLKLNRPSSGSGVPIDAMRYKEKLSALGDPDCTGSMPRAKFEKILKEWMPDIDEHMLGKLVTFANVADGDQINYEDFADFIFEG